MADIIPPNPQQKPLTDIGFMEQVFRSWTQLITSRVNSRAFRGALLELTSPESLPGGSTVTVNWDAAVYDTDNFWNISNPDRLTIPAGISKVRLVGGMTDTSSVTGQLIASVRRNGTSIIVISEIDTAGGDGVNVSSAVVEVVEGDYFALFAFVSTTRTVDVSEATFLSIEAVEWAA